ncbi:MAG: hypothetical protein FWC95_00385 [Defluviitaleaceae bacterium]|nr:hypothetical protein [Defluviitaleaceae bacterium]
MPTRKQLQKRFNSSRANLIGMTFLTCVNIILILTQSAWYFPFSAFIPAFLIYFNSTYHTLSSTYSFAVLGITAAVLTTSIYVVLWILSKKFKGLIIAALVYFSIDTLILLGITGFVIVNGEFEFFIIIEIMFSAWIIYYLISGTVAWAKMRKLPIDQDNINANAEEDDETADNIPKTIAIAQILPTTALRQASKRGRKLIKANYNNMEIIVSRKLNVTELIVDGTVYAEQTGIREGTSYTLEVNVNGVIINVTTVIPTIKEAFKNETHTKVILYVNGNLLAEKARYF